MILAIHKNHKSPELTGIYQQFNKRSNHIARELYLAQEAQKPPPKHLKMKLSLTSADFNETAKYDLQYLHLQKLKGRMVRPRAEQTVSQSKLTFSYKVQHPYTLSSNSFTLCTVPGNLHMLTKG